MATKFFCDRCGKEIDGELCSNDRLLPDNLVLKYPSNYLGDKEHSRYFDLCPTCFNAVLNDITSNSYKKQNKEQKEEKNNKINNETKTTNSIFKALTCILFVCGILGLLFDWNKIVTLFLFILNFFLNYASGYFDGFVHGMKNKHKFNI